MADKYMFLISKHVGMLCEIKTVMSKTDILQLICQPVVTLRVFGVVVLTAAVGIAKSTNED